MMLLPSGEGKLVGVLCRRGMLTDVNLEVLCRYLSSPPLGCLSISSATSISTESTITDNASSAVERTLQTYHDNDLWAIL
jgi:hypothetical protein